MQKLTTYEAIATLLEGQTICKYSDSTIKLEPDQSHIRYVEHENSYNPTLGSRQVMRILHEGGPWVKVWADGIYSATQLPPFNVEKTLFREHGVWKTAEGDVVAHITDYENLKFLRPFPEPLTDGKRETYDPRIMRLGRIVYAVANGSDLYSLPRATAVDFIANWRDLANNPKDYVRRDRMDQEIDDDQE